MKRKMSMLSLSITILMISLARVQSASVTMSMPQISKMDVQCSRSGMTVDVEFDLPFDGIIFSKGHFSDPACRFVEKGSNRNQYSFSIPAGGCGTKDSDLGSRSNILIFQFDPILQEIWDSSRQVSCRSAEKVTKYVTWKPLTVDMLDVQQGNGQDVDCWMDILKGTYPLTKPINGNVKIGEELSLVIYLKDPNGDHDVAVRDCWAYDDSEIDAQSTLKVQLTTTDGCAKKPKLMHFWRQTSQVGDSTATLITYSNITAFRFPSSNGQVYFTCNVDVCEGSCFKKDCLGEESYVNEVTSKAPVTTVRPVTTSARIVLQTLPYPIPETTPTPYRPIPVVTTSTPPDCSKGSLDERCPSTRPPISIPNCVTNPGDPRCPELETTTAPISCYPGSSDPRCPTTTSRTPSSTTTPFYAFKTTSDAPYSSTPKSFVCLPDSTDPRCPKSANTPRTTPKPFSCFPGSTDPRCPPRSCDPESSDSECPPPSIIPTPGPIVCFPGSKDPRCPTAPCAPGSIDCEEPVDCTPETDDPRCPTRAPLVCVPGSRDPRCPQPLTEAPPPTCNPGSTDPRCPTTTTRRTTVRTTTSKTEGEPEGKEAVTQKSGGKGWEGADPRYHAFHSWLYQPAPKPRGGQTKTVENA